MLDENKIVHGLWIGSRLSPVELLCLHSFLEQGHEFHLWTYSALETALPEAVVVENAAAIIPEHQVFAYKNRNQFGHGKGSYAGFSDIFRYRLLYLKGGWWSDLDVVCLSPLDFQEPYVFRTHHDFAAVGNIMKCPAGAPLMVECYEKAINAVHADNADWNLPISILNEGIAAHSLQSGVREFSNQDSWRYVRTLLFRNPRLPEHWKVLHLVNEEWRRNRINKHAIPAYSCIGQKISKYDIQVQGSGMEVFKNLFRILFPRGALIQAYWFFARIFWKVIRVFKKERLATSRA